MKLQRILIGITVINLGLLILQLTGTRRAESAVEAARPAPVLRGSALEIVDEQGRVRASIKLHPADPNFKWPDGRTGYPETVMFRLIDAKGRPEVKIGASEQGGGVGLVGETDSTQALLQTEGAESLLKLVHKDGRRQLIKP